MILSRLKLSVNGFLFGSLLLAGQMIVSFVFDKLIFPFNSFLFYVAVVLIFTLIFNYKYLKNSIFAPLVFFSGLYLFQMLIGVYNNSNFSYGWLLTSELLPIFVSFLFYSIWIRHKQLVILRLFLRIVLLFVLVTALKSIIGLNRYPLAARQLAGGLALEGDFETIDLYKSIGIAGYHFFYGLAFAMPAFVMVLKKHWSNLSHSVLIMVYIGIIYYAIIKSQLTTALIFATINIIFSVIGLKNIWKSIFVLSVVFMVLFFVPKQHYVNLVKSISEAVPGEALKERLLDLSVAIEFGERGFSGSDTHVEHRLERIPLLMAQFNKSPILGGGLPTGHVFWLDRLSLFGIIGMAPWIVLIHAFIRKTKLFINNELRQYLYLSILSFILIGFFKNNGGVLVYFFCFFTVPALLFLYSSGLSILNNKCK